MLRGFLNIFLTTSLFLLLQSTNCVFSQSHIRGKSTVFRNDSLKVYYQSNFIANSSSFLGSIHVDSTGYFDFELKVNSTLPVYIDLPNSNVYLKVEDSACYDIRLPGGKETDLKRKLYPLTEKEKIPAFIVDEPNGLNFNLLKLNNMLFDIQRYLVFVQDLEKRKKLYDSLIVYLDTLQPKGNIEYFENYKKYRLAKVRQDLFHLKREFYFDSLFAYKPFLYNIPSYLDFFKSYYSKYLSSGIISGDTLIQLIFKYDFKTIVEKIENANQNKLTKEVAQMIAIYNLYQIYYRTKDLQPAIIQMFANLQASNKLNRVQKKIVKDIQ